MPLRGSLPNYLEEKLKAQANRCSMQLQPSYPFEYANLWGYRRERPIIHIFPRNKHHLIPPPSSPFWRDTRTPTFPQPGWFAYATRRMCLRWRYSHVDGVGNVAEVEKEGFKVWFR